MAVSCGERMSCGRSAAIHVTAAFAAVLWAAGALPALAQGSGGDKAPPAVVVTAIQSENVAASQQFLGRIQAIQQVDVVARVEGFLEKVAFKEGDFVKKGALLYQIEQDQYKAQLSAAQAQLATAKAQKAGAEATLRNAQVNLDRQQTLLEKQTVSQSVVDQAQAERDEAAASVQSGQAAIESANAQILTAQINLGYTTITSPIDGRIGATNVTQGNLVNSQSGTLATVVQIDPIRMVFSIPETYWIQFAQENGLSAATAKGEQAFVPQIQLPNGQPYKAEGKLAFISNEVDQTTGTVAVYADFANPDGALLPGGYVTAVLRQAKEVKLPVVPLSAVQEDRQGRYVFVLDTSNRVQERRIETSIQVNDGWAVTSGLQDGDTVVVQGVQKVQPGMEVKPTSISFDQAPQAGASDASSSASSDSSSDAASGGSDGAASSAGSGASGSDGSSSGTASSSGGSASGSGGTSSSSGSGN